MSFACMCNNKLKHHHLSLDEKDERLCLIDFKVNIRLSKWKK